MKPWAVLALLACAACVEGGHRERDADRLYLRGNYPPALQVYATLAASRDDARLWAKAAAAALHMGQLDTAAGAFMRLAVADPTRRSEAGDGLAEVARRAMRSGQMGALASALVDLARVAPERPVTGYAYALVQSGTLSPVALARMLPLAMAGAPDAGTFDSLLLQYGALMAGRSACAEAAFAFRAVTRRSADAGMRDSAGTGYATCALRLGVGALDSNRVIDADRWFGRASRAGEGGWTGRRALVGLGDARLKQGDPIAAAIAWQRAITTGAPGDSLSLLARARLTALAPADSAEDTTRMKVQ